MLNFLMSIKVKLKYATENAENTLMNKLIEKKHL